MMEKLLSLKHVAMTITHNDHKVIYQSAKDWLADMDTLGLGVTPEEIEEMIAADSIWEIHWYPNTPVGFCVVLASTLEKAIEKAVSE